MRQAVVRGLLTSVERIFGVPERGSVCYEVLLLRNTIFSLWVLFV